MSGDHALQVRAPILWILWVTANAAGFAAGGLASAAIEPLLSTLIEYRGTHVISAAVMGASAGLAQWLVLRQVTRLPFARWTLLSSLGFTAGVLGGGWASAQHRLLGVSTNPFAGSWPELPAGIGGATLGLLLGVAQWTVLRRRFPMAWWWIPAGILGFGLALPLVWAWDWIVEMRLGYATGPVSWQAEGPAAIGFTSAIFSGIATVLMTRRMSHRAVDR